MTGEPEMKDEKANVSFLPYQNGDGYSWGGGVILTIGEQSIYLGADEAARQLAFELARRWNGMGDTNAKPDRQSYDVPLRGNCGGYDG